MQVRISKKERENHNLQLLVVPAHEKDVVAKVVVESTVLLLVRIPAPAYVQMFAV